MPKFYSFDGWKIESVNLLASIFTSLILIFPHDIKFLTCFIFTAQKMMFSITDFFIFCAVFPFLKSHNLRSCEFVFHTIKKKWNRFRQIPTMKIELMESFLPYHFVSRCNITWYEKDHQLLIKKWINKYIIKGKAKKLQLIYHVF